jgi:cyclophilin family peptidyl-prolyl cis-trans isomerase
MANTGNPDTRLPVLHRPMPRAWNGKYTIFGAVVEGQDVVERINRGPVHDDRPVQPVKLLTVTIERVGPEPVKKGKK